MDMGLSWSALSHGGSWQQCQREVVFLTRDSTSSSLFSPYLLLGLSTSSDVNAKMFDLHSFFERELNWLSLII